MRSRAVDKLMHMLKPPGQQAQPGGSKPSNSTTSVTGMGKKLFAEGANFFANLYSLFVTSSPRWQERKIDHQP